MTDALARIESTELRDRAAEVLVRMEDTAEAIGKIADVLPLDSREDEEQAAALARELARLVGEGEDLRKEIVRPALAFKRQIDDAFKAPREALRTLRGKIQTRLAEQVVKRKAALAAEQERLRAAAKAKNWEEANRAALAVQQVPERPPEGVAVIEVWEPVAFDLRAIPERFLMVDLVALRAEAKEQVKAGKDAPEVEGVTWEIQTKTITRRT